MTEDARRLPSPTAGLMRLLLFAALMPGLLTALRATTRAASKSTVARRQKALAAVCRDVEALTLHADLLGTAASPTPPHQLVYVDSKGMARLRGPGAAPMLDEALHGPFAPETARLAVRCLRRLRRAALLERYGRARPRRRLGRAPRRRAALLGRFCDVSTRLLLLLLSL